MQSNTMSVTLLLVIIPVELDIRHVYQTIFTNNATILTISRYISTIVYFH